MDDTYVFIQLISSGCEDDAELLKISAKYKEKREIFSSWITPTKRWLDTTMSGVHGLECRDYQLFIDDEPQTPLHPLDDVLQKFYDFIHPSPDSLAVKLVAHSATYHFKLLIEAIEKKGMTKMFVGAIRGFIDTLPIAQDFYSNESDIQTFSLAGLARDLMRNPYSGLVHRASHTLPVLESLATEYIDPFFLNKKIVTYKEALALYVRRTHDEIELDRGADSSRREHTIPSRQGAFVQSRQESPVLSRQGFSGPSRQESPVLSRQGFSGPSRQESPVLSRQGFSGPSRQESPVLSRQGFSGPSRRGPPVQLRQGPPVQSRQGPPVQWRQRPPVQSRQGPPVQSRQGLSGPSGQRPPILSREELVDQSRQGLAGPSRQRPPVPAKPRKQPPVVSSAENELHYAALDFSGQNPAPFEKEEEEEEEESPYAAINFLE